MSVGSSYAQEGEKYDAVAVGIVLFSTKFATYLMYTAKLHTGSWACISLETNATNFAGWQVLMPNLFRGDIQFVMP